MRKKPKVVNSMYKKIKYAPNYDPDHEITKK